MWDIKYRPKYFKDVLGQAGTVAVLRARLQQGQALDTSYLFLGGAGQGKTTLARIFARAILCPNRDPETQEPCDACDSCRDVLGDTSSAFSERDAATQGTVEHVRALLEDLPFALPGALKRMYLFDECHRMSKPAQDALLKAIEEKRMVGFFCTTEPWSIQGPIRSRCEEHTIGKVSLDLIYDRMEYVLNAEGVSFEAEAVKAIIAACDGHVRDVFNRLETIALSGSISTEAVREHLGLHLLELYCDVLLSLGDQQKLCLLIEDACSRVPPEDVAAGLADVALAAYRVAMRLPVEAMMLSARKTQTLAERYGVGVLRLAEFFAKMRPASMTSLLSELLLQGPVGPQLTATRLPVVVMQPAGPQVPVAAWSAPEAPLGEGHEDALAPPTLAAGSAPLPAPAPAAAPPPSPRPAQPAAPYVAGHRGNDPYALTDEDHHAVPKEHPARRATKSLEGGGGVLNLSVAPRDDVDKTPIAPVVWRQLFSEALSQGLA